MLWIQRRGLEGWRAVDLSRMKPRSWPPQTRLGAAWNHQTGWKHSAVILESESREPPTATLAQSVEWSAQEQREIAGAEAAVKAALADANREYERRFNRIFIVCASGKSASEILEICQRRLKNDGETELREAAEQQRQITQIRLKKWLQG